MAAQNPHDSAAAPFTDAQVEWLAQRDEYLWEEHRGWFERRFKTRARKATVGFLILLAGVGFTQYSSDQVGRESRDAIVQSGRALAVDGCNRDFNSIQRLRSLLQSAQSAQRRAFLKGQVTPTQYAEGVKFYTEQLAQTPLPDCRHARNILTDDPSKPIQVPTPLHPPEPTVAHGNP